MAKSKIHIKKSKVGSLHTHLGVKQGEKISRSKLSIKPGDSPAIRKKKQFAINMHGHKEQGGYLLNSEDYGFGSWLSRNVGNIAQVVGGAVLTATGVGAPVGIGMMASGVGGAAKDAVSEKMNKDQESLNQQQAWKEQGQARLDQYNLTHQSVNTPTFALGGDVNELNQRNDLGYKYYAWGGTPSWDPNERPMQNSLYAAGGDINQLSNLRGYGYNLMPEGGYVENPAWYRSNALSMKDGGQLLQQIEQQQIPNPGGGLNKQLITKGDGVDIYKVNGNFVRHNINPDFVVGGHHYVGPKYKAIPKNEVWIDDAYANNPEDPSEKAAMDAAIIHELNERNEMKNQGKSYDKAHDDSNKVEQQFEAKEGYAYGGNINRLNDITYYGANEGFATGGHLPEGNATLKEAKEFIKLYPDEMKMGEEVEYEHTGNKKLAQRIAADHIKDHLAMTQGKDPGYYKALQMAGVSDELNKMPQMAKGGVLKPAKAQEMLKDGKIHGKPITDRQKRYFQAIAHGWQPGAMMGGGPMDSLRMYALGGPGSDSIGIGIGIKDIAKDPIIKNMENASNRYDEVTSRYGNLSKQVTGDMIPVKDKSSFTIKDIENGQPGIRNAGKVNKEVLAALSKAAAKKKVPLMRALETGMRETGLGSHNNSVNNAGAYLPADIMQNSTEVGLPDSFDQYLLKNNLVDNKDIKKDNRGLQVVDPYKYNQHIGTYDKYLSSYKNPYAGSEPFDREMDVIKNQHGQAYNPNEKDRVAKLERERRVIMNNPQIYNYADSVYNSNRAYGGYTNYDMGGIVNKLPSTGGIQDQTSSGSMKDDKSNDKTTFTAYNGGGTHQQNSLGGIPIGGKAKVEAGEVRFDDPDTGESYIFSNKF